MNSITAIVPTFNRRAMLAEALDALLRQTRPLHEIIVVDDGSTDGTRAFVATLPPPVRYLFKENGGKSTALNLGLRHATGDFIWICDDDDLALPNGAELLADAIEASSAAFAFGHYRRFRVDPATGAREIFHRGYWPELGSIPLFQELMHDFCLFQAATIVRREVYGAVGPFRADLLRSQDYEMMLRIAERFDGVYVPASIFLEREHDGERGSAADRFEARERYPRWLEGERTIFRELRRRLPLAAYAPPDLPDGRVLKRAAPLQRACISARKKLWTECLEDLHEAAEWEGVPLSDVERRVCRRSLLSKYGCEEVAADSSIARRLRSLGRESALGRAVVKEVCRPLFWHIETSLRHGKRRRALGLSRALCVARGLSGVAAAARAARAASRG